MTVSMETKAFDEYLSKAESLNIKNNLDALIKYIENEEVIQKFADSDYFFKAEKSFYKCEYDKAMAGYLQARQAPYYEFFCYRATAFVSYLNDDLEKAKAFIDKALQIIPNEYATLKLYKKLLEKMQNGDLAAEIDKKIIALEEKVVEKQEPAKDNEEVNEETDSFIARHLGVDIELEKELEMRFQTLKEMNRAEIEKYIALPRSNRDMFLYSFSGFNEIKTALPGLQNQFEKTTYGLFLMWKGKGIVINPGPHFLDNFHNAGFNILDISHVIATSENPETYCDIQKIYDLNYQVNNVNPEIHSINYWLNQKTYRDQSGNLKPNFKQERNTLHSLELFLDSPDVEKEEIEDGITLNYFSTASSQNLRHANSKKTALSLGIKIDLTHEDKSVKVGFISGSPWSPTIANNLGASDILITGFGKTDPNDFGKLNYSENCLGYFGTYTLLEEVKPKLLLMADFEEKVGEYRLEVIRKLRKEFNDTCREDQHISTILPLDIGFLLDLENMLVKCSISNNYFKPDDIRVVKSHENFSPLRYLSPKCII